MEIDFENLSHCLFCFSENLVFLFKAKDRLTNLPGEFSLCRCGDCGLVFQNPRVKKEFINHFYTKDIGYLKPHLEKKEVSRLKYFFKNQTLINHFFYKGKKNPLYFLLTWPTALFLQIKSWPYFKENGKVLEIGCADGSFLEELKEAGWQVKGIELSEEVAKFARVARHLDVENKPIEEVSFEAGEFDVIISNMVFEHLYNPFEIIKKVSLWLKPKGELIFSIPYFWGFEFLVFESFSYGLQLPTHTFFFNKKIIKKSLKDNGFAKIKFYHQFFDRDIVVSSQYKYQDTKSQFYKFLGYSRFARIFIIKPFVFILALLGKTSRITVRAIKNEA
ncbi:MAG: class I SAM-dependent methyltransferase [Patescibacteria group bacterium]